MIWSPPLGTWGMIALVAAALAAIAASYVWARRHLDLRDPQALVTLGLRVIALLLLLLFILQPMRLPQPRTVSRQRSVAVMVDISASMTEPVSAAPGAPSRFAEANALLQRHEVLRRLGERARLTVYGFDGRAGAVKPEALGEMTPEGRQTDFAGALDQVRQFHEHDDLAAVLLVSDGRNSQGADPRGAVKRLDTPLYTLAVGSELPKEQPTETDERDLSLDAVAAVPRVILGRSVNVVASVTATGYPPRQVDLELVTKGDVVGTSAAAVSPQQPRRQAMFTVTPAEVGTHTYHVRIPVQDDETDPTNNTAAFKVEVVDPVNRVLYIDRLRHERRFFHRVLTARKNLLMTTLVQLSADRVLVQGNDTDGRRYGAALSPEQLARLKVIIIGDIPASQLDTAQITALHQWVDRGGALMILGGPQCLGPEGFNTTKLAELLPVKLPEGEAYVEQEFRIDLTAEGAAHPAFQQMPEGWSNAPPLLSRFRTASLQPASTVLMATDGSNAPLVVARQLGEGKTAVVLTDSTWRWQLAHDRSQRIEGVSPHSAFWQQMIDWLLPELEEHREQDSEVQLIADRLSYEVGDTATLMISVRQSDGSVVRDAAVDIAIATPDNRPIRQRATLEAEAGGPPVYRATFEVYTPGRYTIQALAKREGRTLGADSAEVTATQPVVEFLHTDPDPQLLRELAAQTGGRALSAADLVEIDRILPLEPRQITVQPSADADAEPIWNTGWLAALFVALMSCEWFIRRRNRWV